MTRPRAKGRDHMKNVIPEGITVLFIAGFGPIVADQAASEGLYRDLLRLPLEAIEGYEGYWHTNQVAGVKHFALWPLDKASQSCFGHGRWPADLPVPQAWLEVDVADVEAATLALEKTGHTPLVRLKTEPWGQIVTRFLSPEGLLLAVTHTPWLRDGAA